MGATDPTQRRCQGHGRGGRGRSHTEIFGMGWVETGTADAAEAFACGSHTRAARSWAR